MAIIVLTMHEETLYCERALRAGARADIMKREATKNVLQAMRRVLNRSIPTPTVNRSTVHCLDYLLELAALSL
jgi:DNA-binding NarL/FixJ family response regulator